MSTALTLGRRVTTTIARELLAAVTGLVMIGFLLGHLGGNFLIFAGPETFNAYAENLQSLGPLLWMARIGLILAFVSHISASVSLYLANRRARGRYAVTAYLGRKSWATRYMIFSGILIFFFLFIHLNDFTLGDKEGAASIVPGMNDGVSLGLYGLVWNSFGNPLRSFFYLVAMVGVGSHLAHALASFWVTLGVLTHKATPKVDLAAQAVGAAVAAGYCSIPLYVLVQTYLIGVQS